LRSKESRSVLTGPEAARFCRSHLVQEGSRWSAQQELAAGLIEQAYAHDPQNPGALHYMIHVYDDPVHAPLGLKAARACAQVAPAVPHALHMPSHIFTRLGYWAESAASNERAWSVSESDTRKAGESGAYRDFHSLNYLQYAYLQLGRYKDAKRLTGIFAAQYEALPNKITHPDTSDLEVRHLRGRTIYDLPDCIVYGYFDTLARYIRETGEWRLASALPSQPVSRDFVAMRLQIDAMAAAKRKDVSGAVAAADKIVALSNQPGQELLVQKILNIQAKEAQAAAAEATGDQEKTIALMDDAVAIEDSIYALSQPPYRGIPAHELYGDMLMEINLPAAAEKQFALALQRTPGRSMALYGLAQSAQAQGDKQRAAKQYAKFLRVWKNADQDLPAISVAKSFLKQTQGGSRD
jgi:tetratricopeptide (TPR) repeat protein